MRRSKYTAQFKFDRVIESLKNDNLVGVARNYGFGVNLLSKWRSDFLKGGHVFFNSQPNQEIVRLQKQIAALEQMVGRKEVELNLLKNFSDFYTSQNGK